MARRLATDVGGTFTDLVMFETDETSGEQKIVTLKVDTTPPDFERGVLAAVRAVLGEGAGVELMAHGSTLVINALTERKGASVGLITTEGFRDVLEIGRGNRPDFFNLRYEKPAPFVARHLRREVPGRMGFDGVEQRPLDLSGLPDLLEDFRAEGIEALAVCLLHSYANPEHERRVADRIAELWPEVPVAVSHEIGREWREYERTSSTVLSAYVQPLVAGYLRRLTDGLDALGHRGRLHVMASNGGIETVAAAARNPIVMVESGPASGFGAAADLGRQIGELNVIALDIGGTTAKCSLVEDGRVRVESTYWIERDERRAGYPIMTPVVDLVEIGNGGGSIAWVDRFGRLQVGPQSAGADPGPVAYGRGGTELTTTDANLVLGRLDPSFFCGGEIEADMDAVAAATARLAERLHLDPIDAARGVIRIANANMINALKLVSVNRGRDPRDFALIAFGGGGPLHATALAADLGVARVVIPADASVFSARGMLTADLRRDLFRTLLTDADEHLPGRLRLAVDELEEQAYESFGADGIDRGRVRLEVGVRLRYQNQEHSVEVPLRSGSGVVALEELLEDFQTFYEQEYKYRLSSPVELVGIHLIARGDVGRLTPTARPTTGRSVDETIIGTRQIDFAPEPVAMATVHDGALLEAGMSLDGPAAVELSGASMLIGPGWNATVDDYGNLRCAPHALTEPRQDGDL